MTSMVYDGDDFTAAKELFHGNASDVQLSEYAQATI